MAEGRDKGTCLDDREAVLPAITSEKVGRLSEQGKEALRMVSAEVVLYPSCKGDVVYLMRYIIRIDSSKFE